MCASLGACLHISCSVPGGRHSACSWRLTAGLRRRADGRRGVARWSIYALDWQAEGSAELRITPAGVDVMTPTGAPGAKWLAVATRAGNGFRRAAARCGACPRACTPGAH